MAWTQTTSLLIGFLFVSACAYLAAVYLIEEAARRDDDRLRSYFTLRAIAAGTVAGALSLATLFELHTANEALFNRLTGRALAFVVLAGVIGLAVLALLLSGRAVLFRGRAAAPRVLSALGVVLVVWGWGVAQYPTLLPGTGVTLSRSGAPNSTQVALVVLFVIFVLVVGPAFVLLFALQGRQALGSSSDGLTPAPQPPPPDSSAAG
jgi:cytochrome d ubiquinol oxidase subunit II